MSDAPERIWLQNDTFGHQQDLEEYAEKPVDEVLGNFCEYIRKPKLQLIETAPDLERVFVAGYKPRDGSVAGYWWYHEDVVTDGKAIERPHATHWFPIIKPEFPPMPGDFND